MNYEEAYREACLILADLEPFCERIEIAGSIRREKQKKIKDIEIVCVRKLSLLYKFKPIVERWSKINGEATGLYTQRRVNGKKLDLFMPFKNNFGLIYFIRTGPAEFSKQVMGYDMKRKGYVVRDGYVWKDDKKIPTPEEQDVFDLLGWDYIKPKDRK